MRARQDFLVMAMVAMVGIPGAWAEEGGRAERRPGEFFSIFSFGYGGDDFPADVEVFAKLVRKIAGEGQFNAILCQYSDERAAICEELGVKMMVDLLGPEHHVYRTPERAEELCVGLRGNPVVMGYHLWSDRIGGSGEGRARDIANVRGWDPTHASYAATYRTDGIGHLVGADIFGWYDFHWKRGVGRRFPQLLAGWRLAREHDAIFYVRAGEFLMGVFEGEGGGRSAFLANHNAYAEQQVELGLEGVAGVSLFDRVAGEWRELELVGGSVRLVLGAGGGELLRFE